MIKEYFQYGRYPNWQEGLDAVQEADGNPDIALLFAMDCFDQGEKRGFLIGIACAVMVKGISVIRKKIKNRRPK
jgi:hypothetical protein